jgi:signal transduction histidine kinase
MLCALGGGVFLAGAWSLFLPWLAGLAASPRLLLAVAALVAGGAAAASVPRGRSGSRDAGRLGLIFAAVATLGALLSGLALRREAGGYPGVALVAGALGSALLVALVAAGAAYTTNARTLRRGAPGGAALSLPVLIGAVTGALTFAGWSLATARLVGQRHTDAERRAVIEARDLTAIVLSRLGATGQRTFDLPELVPPGGFLAFLDEEGVAGDVLGVGLVTGDRLKVAETPTWCRATGRPLPCAVRRLVDGRRLVAAVPIEPVEAGLLFAFAVVGLVCTAAAGGFGALVGLAQARDLERMAETVDSLKRGAKTLALSLEQPIVVASLDELGELAAALGRLRKRLHPMIEEYRVALEKAEAADRARDEFLSMVSVELRSPLNQIIASSQALIDLKAEPLSAEQKDDVKTILSASRHLTDLIDEVLDVSAIATGQVSLRLEEVDLCKVVAEVAKAQRPTLRKKGVEVTLDLEPACPRIRADERRVRQVITNIVSNAVKFTDKGSIDITVRTRDDKIEIRVKDTGPGIAAEQLPRLFEEFVQLGSLRQRAHGTGLGLAICKRLVEAHDGSVSAASELGKGSTFTVVLPVAGPREARSVTDDTPVEGVEELG